MAKPIYITLDALVFDDDNDQDTKLVKQVTEDYLSRTFSELIEKMVDGSPDEYNEVGYNAQEMEIATHVRGLLTTANTDPGRVQIYAYSKDTPPEEINVRLNDKISDYNDRILTIETIPGESGEDKTFRKIALSISDNDPGGLNLVMNYQGQD
jgi:hypothetical protein